MKLAPLLLTLSLAGCATGEVVRGGEQSQREQTVRMGVVETVRDVQIEAGQNTGVGGVIGAVAGGVAGSYVGSGRGGIVGSVVGSVLGGLAGHTVEQAAGRRAGVELTVRLDEGRSIVIAQAVSGDTFKPGDRVRVIADGVVARVEK
jgi:outer membrane lipoprotein SlyB